MSNELTPITLRGVLLNWKVVLFTSTMLVAFSPISAGLLELNVKEGSALILGVGALGIIWILLCIQYKK